MKALKLCSLPTALLVTAGLLLFSQSLRSEAKDPKPAKVTKPVEAKKTKVGAKKGAKKKPGMGNLPLLKPDGKPFVRPQKFGKDATRNGTKNNHKQIAALQKKLAAKDKEITALKAKTESLRDQLLGARGEIAKLQELTKSKDAFTKPQKDEPEKAAPLAKKAMAIKVKKDPLTKIAPIYYKERWAVNYQERDRVLELLKELFEEKPKTKVTLIGHADDSKFSQTNQDVSFNRARFLASYLFINGINKNSVSYKGVGNTLKPKIGPNRRVDIYIK